jgi:hypothetical protein
MPTDRRKTTPEDLRREVLAKISHYSESGFPEAVRIHELIMEANPLLVPRLWYGMPGYAKSEDAPVLCFFRKDTYISFGITESVKPVEQEGAVPSAYPSAWYLTRLDDSVETLIQAVVKQATL